MEMITTRVVFNDSQNVVDPSYMLDNKTIIAISTDLDFTGFSHKQVVKGIFNLLSTKPVVDDYRICAISN